MATCIKSLLLASIVSELKTITAIKDVVLNPSDLPEDADRHPFCAVVDETETTTRDNRIKRGMFDLRIVVWTMSEKGEEKTTDLDELHAQIYQKLTNNVLINAYCQKLEELSAEKLFYNELESGLINLYEVIYSHAWGKPYTLNPERN